MTDISIRFSNAAKVTKGDLGAHVDNGTLVLPVEVQKLAAHTNVTTASGFFSALSTFPSSFARALNWDREDVASAEGKLRDVLKGHVRGIDAAPISRPTGAYLPNGPVRA